MPDIKYNNVAIVRLRSERQAIRFTDIVRKQPLAQGCKVLRDGCSVSLLVPQDAAKAMQVDRMTSFRNAVKIYQASIRGQRARIAKRTRIALKDVLESFPPLYASDDTEAVHHAADLLLCTALEALGQKDIVNAWRKVGKHYA